MASGEVPRLADATIDGTVLGFCMLATFAWVVTLGTMPLWRRRSAETLELAQHLAIRATRSGRTLRVMIVAQVTAAVIVATAAGLLVRSFARLHAVDRGFDASRLAVSRSCCPKRCIRPPARVKHSSRGYFRPSPRSQVSHRRRRPTLLPERRKPD